MKIQSSMSKKDYMIAMRMKMSDHFEFNVARFTGFFLGSCFYVTYHSGYEWNRKVTNQKNAAMGYVKDTPDGCEVRYIRFAGLLCPLQFIPFIFTAPLVLFLFLLFKDGWDPVIFKATYGIMLVMYVLAAPISALLECCTEKSQEGRRLLISFLKDPAEPRKHLPYIP